MKPRRNQTRLLWLSPRAASVLLRLRWLTRNPKQRMFSLLFGSFTNASDTWNKMLAMKSCSLPAVWSELNAVWVTLALKSCFSYFQLSCITNIEGFCWLLAFCFYWTGAANWVSWQTYVPCQCDASSPSLSSSSCYDAGMVDDISQNSFPP